MVSAGYGPHGGIKTWCSKHKPPGSVLGCKRKAADQEDDIESLAPTEDLHWAYVDPDDVPILGHRRAWSRASMASTVVQDGW